MIKEFHILAGLILLVTSSYYTVEEKSPPGTTVLSNLSQILAQSRNLYFSNTAKSSLILKISNLQDPGVSWFKIDAESDSLVVNEEPNRDYLCSSKKIQPINFLHSESNKITLIYPKVDTENSSQLCLIKLIIVFGPANDPGIVPLNININDINDHNPAFSQTELVIRMREHSMLDYGTSVESERFTIPLPTALDEDIFHNDIRSYHIDGEDSSYFKLLAEMSDDGQLKLFLCGVKIISSSETCTRNAKLFDREQREEFSLTLNALDDGLPSKVGKLKIRIILEDVNDVMPAFNQPNYEGKFNENDPQGTVVLKVSAYDEDVDFQNSKINFRLPGSFTKTKAVLSPAQMAAANFFDLEIDSKQTSVMSRNITWARLIIKPTNTETRLKSMQALMEAAKSDNEAFHAYRTGSNNMKKLEFTIEALDHGDPMLIAQAKISLLVVDVNNMKPNIFITYMNPVLLNKNTIHQMNYGKILENQDRAMLAHVIVSDQDTFVAENDLSCNLSDNRFILEEIYDSQRQMNPFDNSDKNTKSYKLMSVTKLDRERSGSKSGETFKFHISCTDNMKGILPGGRLTTVQEVRVIVGDENDNYPVFEKEKYEFSVPENEPNFELSPNPAKYRIGTLRATDADDAENAVVKYKLLTNPYEAFEIDEKNGSLYVVRPFDREQIDNVTLKVLAIDHEYEQYMISSYERGIRDRIPFEVTSTAVVDVIIEDVNDCAPRFRETTYYFEVEENSSNFDIGFLEAIDDDKSNGTKISYHLGYPSATTSKGSEILLNDDLIQIFSHFQLDRNTGQLKLKQKLDRELKANYEFMVYATDNSVYKHHNQKTGTTSVLITVLDVNDNSPVINSPKHQEEFICGKSITAGNHLFSIEADDLDLGENRTLRYMLINEKSQIDTDINGTRPFQSLPIAGDENSGVFYFTKTLTINTAIPYTYSLNILVEDMGSKVRLNSSITVYVTLGAEQSELHSAQQNLDNYDGSRNMKINTKMILLILSSVFILLMIMLMILIGYKRIFTRTSTSAIGPDGYKIPGYHTPSVLKSNSVALNNMIKNQYMDDFNNHYIQTNTITPNVQPQNMSPKMSTMYRINCDETNSVGRQRKAYYLPVTSYMNQHRYMQTRSNSPQLDDKTANELDQPIEDHKYMTMIQPNHCFQPYTEMNVKGKPEKYEKIPSMIGNGNQRNLKLYPIQTSQYEHKDSNGTTDQVFFLDKNMTLFTIKNNNIVDKNIAESESSHCTSNRSESRLSLQKQNTNINNIESSFV